MADLPDEITVGHRKGKGIVISGADTRECIACGEDVIVNPATIKSIEEGIYPEEVACVQCAAEEVTDDG